jgi:hypothetical protein
MSAWREADVLMSDVTHFPLNFSDREKLYQILSLVRYLISSGGNSSPFIEIGLCLALTPLDRVVLGDARTKLSESFHSGLEQDPSPPVTDAGGRPEKNMRPKRLKLVSLLLPPPPSNWRELRFHRSMTMISQK